MITHRCWPIALCALALSCGAAHEAGEQVGAAWIHPPSGAIAMAGVVIEAEDLSFRLASGTSFRPPFYTEYCLNDPAATSHPLAMAAGAQRVRITIPGLDRPLYGVIAFCSLHPDNQSPARRSYHIEIPPEYVERAQTGDISVVFERTPFVLPNGANDMAWQLWISRTPLLAPPARPTGS